MKNNKKYLDNNINLNLFSNAFFFYDRNYSSFFDKKGEIIKKKNLHNKPSKINKSSLDPHLFDFFQTIASLPKNIPFLCGYTYWKPFLGFSYHIIKKTKEIKTKTTCTKSIQQVSYQRIIDPWDSPLNLKQIDFLKEKTYIFLDKTLSKRHDYWFHDKDKIQVMYLISKKYLQKSFFHPYNKYNLPFLSKLSETFENIHTHNLLQSFQKIPFFYDNNKYLMVLSFSFLNLLLYPTFFLHRSSFLLYDNSHLYIQDSSCFKYLSKLSFSVPQKFSYLNSTSFKYNIIQPCKYNHNKQGPFVFYILSQKKKKVRNIQDLLGIGSIHSFYYKDPIFYVSPNTPCSLSHISFFGKLSRKSQKYPLYSSSFKSLLQKGSLKKKMFMFIIKKPDNILTIILLYKHILSCFFSKPFYHSFIHPKYNLVIFLYWIKKFYLKYSSTYPFILSLPDNHPLKEKPQSHYSYPLDIGPLFSDTPFWFYLNMLSWYDIYFSNLSFLHKKQKIKGKDNTRSFFINGPDDKIKDKTYPLFYTFSYLFHDFLPYNLLFYSKLLYIILKDSCRSTYVKEILYNNNIVNTGGADNNHLIDDIFIKEIFNMYNFSNNFIYSDTFFSNTNVFSSENNNTFNALIKYQKLSYSFSYSFFFYKLKRKRALVVNNFLSYNDFFSCKHFYHFFFLHNLDIKRSCPIFTYHNVNHSLSSYIKSFSYNSTYYQPLDPLPFFSHDRSPYNEKPCYYIIVHSSKLFINPLHTLLDPSHPFISPSMPFPSIHNNLDISLKTYQKLDNYQKKNYVFYNNFI